LAKQIVMVHNCLRSLSIVVSVAVKHITRSDGSIQLWSSKY